MNCKENKIHFLLLEDEIEEAISAVFQTVLFHRTLPTLIFKNGCVSYNSYIGTNDVDCQTFPLTYIEVSCTELHNRISEPVNQFAKVLRDSSSDNRGNITLEFATHKKGWALGGHDSAPWERWVINVELARACSVDVSQHKARLAMQVTDELFHAMELLSGPQSYVPSMGNSKTETEAVVDFGIAAELCPFRFGVLWKTSAGSGNYYGPSGNAGNATTPISQAAGFVGSAVKRMLKDGKL